MAEKSPSCLHENKPTAKVHPMSAVNVFVAAIYADQWYFGKVTEIDVKDNEVQVNFMANAGKYGETYIFSN